MRLYMDLELQDIPGQLLLALQPFRDNKANIIETVNAKLKDCGISVVRACEDCLIKAVSMVPVGHVLHSDLEDTINRIYSTGFAEVMDVSLTTTGVDKSSSAYL
jgi:ACT domain-containing protein